MPKKSPKAAPVRPAVGRNKRSAVTATSEAPEQSREAAGLQGRRAELLAALLALRENLRRRREMFHALPRRGYPPTPPPVKRPLVYRPPTSGTVEILRKISAGELELITAELVGELITELEAR